MLGWEVDVSTRSSLQKNKLQALLFFRLFFSTSMAQPDSDTALGFLSKALFYTCNGWARSRGERSGTEVAKPRNHTVDRAGVARGILGAALLRANRKVRRPRALERERIVRGGRAAKQTRRVEHELARVPPALRAAAATTRTGATRGQSRTWRIALSLLR